MTLFDVYIYYCYRSFDVTLPADLSTAEFDVTYRVLQGATLRGKEKLVDNQGYSFTVKVRIYIYTCPYILVHYIFTQLLCSQRLYH